MVAAERHHPRDQFSAMGFAVGQAKFAAVAETWSRKGACHEVFARDCVAPKHPCRCDLISERQAQSELKERIPDYGEPAEIANGAQPLTWPEIAREGTNEYAWNGRRGCNLQDE